MPKRESRVYAYWIERGSGAVNSVMMGPDDVFRGGTYESEVHLKHAADAVEVLVIPLAQFGSDWAKEAIAGLKARGDRIGKSGSTEAS